jgi:menaquinone-dependent protoporphyrinogen oxidase
VHVLVVVASKHGATLTYATAIAATFERHGIEVTLSDTPDEVRDLGLYDAVVLGSAVYVGRWQPSARSFASRLREQLEVRPTWLFSSGPVGDPPLPIEDPVDVADVLAITGARAHRTFPGAIAIRKLSRAERLLVRMRRVPERDDRDLSAATTWADELVAALVGGAEHHPAG